ncbi:MAG: amino acid adenylation domain-containing protein [Pseudomonadota bacterium]
MDDTTSKDDRRERLDAARRELLKRRLQGGAASKGKDSVASAIPALAPREDRTTAPASYAQARLYFLDQLHGAGAAYHMVLCLRLRGALDREALQAALDTVVRRHASLRTTFELRGSELLQRVGAPFAVALETYDLTDAQEGEGALREVLRRWVQRPLSLGDGPLLRAGLIAVGADQHVFALVLHHIIADEWSLGVLRRELANAYGHGGSDEGLSAAVEVDYGDYALWQQAQVARQRTEQLAFWRDQLGDLDGAFAALPGDFRRPARASLRGGWQQRRLDGALASAVSALARQHQATPYMVLLAAFLAVLYRLSGQSDVRVGTPVASRAPAQSEQMVGLFLNSVVIREQIDGARSFEELLARVRETSLAAVEHQGLPFEVLVAELQPERDLGANPLFQTMFVLESDEGAEASFGALAQERMPVESGFAKLDLTCFVNLDDGQLTVSVEYASDLYDGATAMLLIDAYAEYLSGAIATPGAALDSLPLVTPAQADELRARSRGAVLPVAGDSLSVVPSILARALARGDAVMVSDGAQSFTGEALHEAVCRVAGALQGQGVGQGDCVLVALPRGAQQIVALLGVMVAGAAYVPIDPDYPDQRRRQVIADLTARAGRTPLMLAGSAAPTDGVEVLTLAGALAQPPLANPPTIDGNDLAYVLYTSGSSGRAKGVAIRHRNLLASTQARSVHYPYSPARYLLVSSYAFDSSVAGIFWTLMDGDTLVVPPAPQAIDPRALGQLIEAHRITHTLMLPDLYALLLEASTHAQLATLRTVIVAGEACPVGVVQRHAQVLGERTQLTNEYGPTEGTVWASAYDCTGAEVDHVPIGRPIAGAETFVLDARGALLPDGAIGELWIGGAGIAEGYIGQAALTEASFRSPSAVGSGRCYRTGDLVRRGPGGELEYLGRADEQIKLRGFRIEPAEIESLLRAHPQVHDAAVGLADERLVAWCVAQGEVPTASVLRQHLAVHVPAYMVPSHFQMLESLPRLPNGKIDRQRLPEVVTALVTPTARRDYADDTERDLAAIWRKLLSVEQVGPEDDFFELGGHSLAGVSLMLEIERRFGRSLPLAALFEAPRLSALAERLRETGEARARSPLLMPVQPNGSRPPLFCVHGGARQAARHLGEDQPVYLAFTHLSERDSEGNSVQTMAERYLEEVRGVQPRGPYRLCGFSFGGKIAYEMACRLDAQGERVSLALCDPPPPAGADYYRQQWRVRREELKTKGVGGGGLRWIGRVVKGRVRTWRMRMLDAYFSRTRRSSRALYGAASALLALGLALWAGAGWVLNQPTWRPLVLDLTPAQVSGGTFVAEQDGRIELALEVDKALPLAALRRSALAVKQPAPLDVRWQALGEDAATIASGDVRDYAYIDPGPRTPVGRLRRILLRVPFGQSDPYFASFGLRGLPAAERGVGAFEVQAGKLYRVNVETGADLASVETLSPRFVARLDRGRFAARYSRTAPYSIGGLLTVLLGLLLGVLTFIRQHQNTPASLISYRDRQHYRRMSARYHYPAYNGDLTLLLPQTYEVYREETAKAWGAKVRGTVHLELVAGARRHVDLINETAGELLAAGLGRWLRRAEEERDEPKQ